MSKRPRCCLSWRLAIVHLTVVITAKPCNWRNTANHTRTYTRYTFLGIKHIPQCLLYFSLKRQSPASASCSKYTEKLFHGSDISSSLFFLPWPSVWPVIVSTVFCFVGHAAHWHVLTWCFKPAVHDNVLGPRRLRRVSHGTCARESAYLNDTGTSACRIVLRSILRTISTLLVKSLRFLYYLL